MEDEILMGVDGNKKINFVYIRVLVFYILERFDFDK